MEACIDEQPYPLLNRYVEAFWHSEPGTETMCDVLPDASVDVCFALSESKPEIVVFGPSTALTAYQIPASVAHFGVRLKPGAAACQGKVEMSPFQQSRNVPFCPCLSRVHVNLRMAGEAETGSAGEQPVKE